MANQTNHNDQNRSTFTVRPSVPPAPAKVLRIGRIDPSALCQAVELAVEMGATVIEYKGRRIQLDVLQAWVEKYKWIISENPFRTKKLQRNNWYEIEERDAE